MLMYGRKKNKWLNEWMKEKMCEVTTVSLHDLQERNYKLKSILIFTLLTYL